MKKKFTLVNYKWTGKKSLCIDCSCEIYLQNTSGVGVIAYLNKHIKWLHMLLTTTVSANKLAENFLTKHFCILKISQKTALFQQNIWSQWNFPGKKEYATKQPFLVSLVIHVFSALLAARLISQYAKSHRLGLSTDNLRKFLYH